MCHAALLVNIGASWAGAGRKESAQHLWALGILAGQLGRSPITSTGNG